MDKRGEQIPAGGIEVAGRVTVSEGKSVFCSDRTKTWGWGGGQSGAASLPTMDLVQSCCLAIH